MNFSSGNPDAANKMVQFWIANGYCLFIGTPCGILSPLFCSLENRRANLVYAPREDLAVAVACGYSMRGQKALVLMQNSGLGQSVNVLASLVQPFRIPIHLVISLRGCSIDKTQENSVMGRLTCNLLSQLKIPFHIAKSTHLQKSLEWIECQLTQSSRAAALVITPEFLSWDPDH